MNTVSGSDLKTLLTSTTLALALGGLGTLALPAPATAGVTDHQASCRRAAGSAAAKYFKMAAGALAKCRDAVSTGKLAAGTDCGTEPKTALKISKAAGKLTAQVVRSCADPVVTTLRFGGDCEDETTSEGLVTCLRADHDSTIADLVAVLYTTPGEIPAAERKCQHTASKQSRKVATAWLKQLRKCKDAADADKLPVGTLCTGASDTVARLAKTRSKASDAIAARCGATLAGPDFGAPCDLAADAPDLASCLLSITDASADAASLTVYGDGAFCGDSHQAVEGRIDDLLAKLSLEEKVIQMHGNSSLTGSGWGTAGNAALGIPGFRMLDGPRGVSLFAGNGSAFPVAIARGASWDVGLERRVGKAIGLEARAKGASVILAPVTSVIRHPRWGRSQESYGEDPLHIGRMGVAFVKGAQQHVISSVKHFAVNSIEDTRMTVDVTVDERTLREIYLPHFRMVVEDADVASVMSAYNLVNDAYCAENSHLLSDILKGEWGFRGFVESDWIFGTHNTVPSALAGLDIEMPIPLIYGQPLIDAVNLGDIDESVIDGALRRILRAQLCFRLDTDPPLPQPDAVESPAHVDLALEAALKGSVLLENKAAALPLDRALLTEIVVTGPLADEENIGDSGSSNVAPTEIVTVLEGMQARSGAVTITHVADPSTPGGMASIAGADAVVVVTGLTSGDEGEQLVGSGDRDSYSLPLDREQLILAVAALNARTIVVLEGGSAIGVEGWIDEVEALLMAWYPGMQGGNAIADLLFGDANPSGKLPLVAAVQESDLPPFINDQDEVTYDYYHGYRLLDRDAVAPRYPFGYGLSYTNYSYSDLTIVDSNLEIDDTLRVTFNVTNTANMAGEEVAQLYVSTVGSSVDRPVRDLEGFARVSLAPGQTKTVSIEVPVDHLAYYDVTLPGWRVETIEYGVHVGPSSADLPLEASFTVE